MMLAYFVFGASSPQRNPDFRIASQKFLIDLVSQVCQETDSFHITLQAVGDQGRLRWPVPKNAQVPIRAFLADHGVMNRFEEQWAFMQQDCVVTYFHGKRLATCVTAEYCF